MRRCPLHADAFISKPVGSGHFTEAVRRQRRHTTAGHPGLRTSPGHAAGPGGQRFLRALQIADGALLVASRDRAVMYKIADHA